MVMQKIKIWRFSNFTSFINGHHYMQSILLWDVNWSALKFGRKKFEIVTDRQSLEEIKKSLYGNYDNRDVVIILTTTLGCNLRSTKKTLGTHVILCNHIKLKYQYYLWRTHLYFWMLLQILRHDFIKSLIKMMPLIH